MNQKITELSYLIELSAAMLAKAQEDYWEDVISLESERIKLIEQFFAEPIAAELIELVVAQMQRILEMDQQITDMASVKRFDILQVLQEMEQGKKAVKAYTT